MRRLLVNDALSQLQERTFWHDLQEWFGCEFIGSDFSALGIVVEEAIRADANNNLGTPGLIIRNATWFPPIKTDVPTISLLQDISPDGENGQISEMRKMQEAVIRSSAAVVFNSAFTRAQYPGSSGHVIPLPVNFDLFEPHNPFGLQQVLALPDGCVCWVGACTGAAAQVKGWDLFIAVVRANPDVPFVAVLKDRAPDIMPPNLRCYVRLTQEELVKVYGACRVGLCTSHTESQHLAGIEMGGCGLPLVVPDVGAYWKREGMPGYVLTEPTAADYTTAIRACLASPPDPDVTHRYWCNEFATEVVKARWTKLVEEVENGKGL